MKTIFVILAAGNSRRFKSKIPKQFNNYKGKMILEHSIDKAIKSKLKIKI
jgi:2-C-methyl-D-erythritol 4-phosphate cytidylyltransferase/2-C-methyl-D-erythritol 2,4-cyclodiphosphate synthase